MTAPLSNRDVSRDYVERIHRARADIAATAKRRPKARKRPWTMRLAPIGLAIAGALALAMFASAILEREAGQGEGRLFDLNQLRTRPEIPTIAIPADRLRRGGAVGSEDGLLEWPVSPFDEDVPAITRLDEDLLHALQQAAQDAGADGVALVVTSGWRDAAYQQQLLEEAIEEHGSVEEARRFVATPETSAHVTGEAVDVGPTDGAEWLGRYGFEYGLCRVYANEPWHFELATEPGGECPPLRPDASQ